MIAPGGLAGAEFARNAEYGVTEGARSAGSPARTMASFGESWNCPAGGGRRVRGGTGCAAVLVLLPQLFAVLLELRRRRTGLAEVAALHWAFSWTRACGS